VVGGSSTGTSPIGATDKPELRLRFCEDSNQLSVKFDP
jgi:hypothetical protein